MGGSKTRTFTDALVQQVYKKDNFYNKALIHSFAKTRDAHNTLTMLLQQKIKLLNIKYLEKNGFAKGTTTLSTVTSSNILLYLLKKGYSNCSIKKEYSYYYHYIGYDNYTSYEFVYTHKLSSNELSVDILDGVVEVELQKVSYKPKGKYAFETFTNKSFRLLMSLNNDPNITSTSDNYIAYFKYPALLKNNDLKAKYTYHNYTYNGTTYKIVIENGIVKHKVENGENYIYFEDINDSTNTVWYKPPLNTSIYYIVAVHSNRGDEILIIPRKEVVSTINRYNHFLFIPIKRNFELINYSKAKKIILKKFGITIPSLSDDTIKDVILFAGSKYKGNTYKKLDKINEAIYGTFDNPITITFNINGDILKYTWEDISVLLSHEYESDGTPDTCLISKGVKREVSFNGTGLDSETTMLNKGSERTSCSSVWWIDEMIFGGKFQTGSNKNKNVYAIPIEILREQNLKDFYNMYYETLSVATYVEKTIKLKWYQTSIFSIINFFIAAALIITGHIYMAIVMMTLPAVIDMVLNPILKSLGLSDDAIMVIDFVVVILITHEASEMDAALAAKTQEDATLLMTQSSSSATKVPSVFNTTYTPGIQVTTSPSIFNEGYTTGLTANTSGNLVLTNFSDYNSIEFTINPTNTSVSLFNSAKQSINKYFESFSTNPLKATFDTIDYGSKIGNLWNQNRTNNLIKHNQKEINNFNKDIKKQQNAIDELSSKMLYLNPFAVAEAMSTNAFINPSLWGTHIMYGTSDYGSYTGVQGFNSFNI
jgi:hypothetical protein